MNVLAAIDIGSLFAVAFLLISFVGWIMNIINQQNPPPQPNRPARRPPQRDRKVQSEIEDFLQQAMGRKGPQKRPGESDGIEILEPEEPRRPPAGRPRARSESVPASAETPEPARPVPVAQSGDRGSSLQRTVPSPVGDTLGSGLRSHVEQHMSPRIGEQTAKDLPRLTPSLMGSHLRAFQAGDRDTRREVAPVMRSRAAIGDASALLNEIRQPLGMRKAIVLQEILSKPRALRKR